VQPKPLNFHVEGTVFIEKYSYICRRSVKQHIDEENLPEFVILCVLLRGFALLY
jgi:hypothetical protein